MASAHEDPRFANSVEYTVTLRLRVAGGARQGTAERWARQAAEKLADAATRLGHVVEVTATGGFTSGDGEVTWPTPVDFAEANSGPALSGALARRTRYVDVDHEAARASLAAANAVARQRSSADLARRAEVGCRTGGALLDARLCGCVYCDPPGHAAAADDEKARPGSAYVEHRCVCGRPVAGAGNRCTRHRHVAIVVLDGDPADLARLAAADTTPPEFDATATLEQQPDRLTRPIRDRGFGFDR